MADNREPGRIAKFLHPSIYKEGNDEVVATPEKGIALYWFVLKNYFFQLLGIGLISVVLSIPIVTIPATATAIARVCMKLCLDGYGFAYSEFFTEWKSAILRTLPFGILTGVPTVVGFFVLYLGFSTQEVGLFFLVGSGIALLLLYIVTSFAYPLFALIDLPTRTNARNAVLLSGSQPRTVIRLFIPLAVTVLLVLLLPISLPMLLLLYVPGPALMRAVIVKPPIETLIIKPFLTQNAAEEQGESTARE